MLFRGVISGKPPPVQGTAGHQQNGQGQQRIKNSGIQKIGNFVGFRGPVDGRGIDKALGGKAEGRCNRKCSKMDAQNPRAVIDHGMGEKGHSPDGEKRGDITVPGHET